MLKAFKGSRGFKSIVLMVSSFLGVFCMMSGKVEEKPFVVVIPSYKNADWYKNNLTSVFLQDYSNYKVVYVDDCSPDGTADLVMRYARECGQLDRFILIRNLDRKLKAFNFYHAIHRYCDDEEIVVELDGDDWLAGPNVLSILNQVYSDPNVWMTYGSYVTTKKGQSCCGPYPQRVIELNAYRRYGWKTGHLRTFYAWLFKRIKKEDFMLDGDFVKMAGDQCYMYPLLEMSGGRFKYILDILHVYNRDNILNDDKAYGINTLVHTARRINAKAPYKKIETWLGYP